MTERTVTVTEEAYDALQQAAGDDQTVSEVILAALGRTLIHGEGIDQSGLGEREAAVYDVIQRHIEATKQEDVTGYLETMHPQARTEDLEQQVVELWSQYDIEYRFTVESIAVDGDTATADVLQTTRKVSGPEFRNNTRRERFQFVTEDGEWYVLGSETLDDETHGRLAGSGIVRPCVTLYLLSPDRCVSPRNARPSEAGRR